MSFQTYFKPMQKLLLQIQDADKSQSRTELLTVYIDSIEGNTLNVTLPYGADAVDHYPFKEGLNFDISTESLGLGIRTTGEFSRKIAGDKFSIILTGTMQMFQRRACPRLDCQIGIRFSRAAKTLQTMREIWQRNMDVLYSPEAPLIFEGFKQTKVNISSGGLRLLVKPPANQDELCLVLINLEDGKPPICTIAEIVWSCTQNENSVTVGMRFINILSEDQLRIERFIRENI